MALELLAPAKNADQGILALRCGADAVYMGGPQFGARQAAGNGLEDFEQVTREARLWGAKVFATLNTILFDAELEAARRQAWELYEAGVDALIIQDMAFLEMDLPPLPLHASTQAACDSPERVAFLASAGFSRAILARELSLDDIRAIHGAADIELEAFVFGALCVGESGLCYLSGAICERSGNRGECAQPCRAPWNLVDASNRVVVREKHLLNIRDLDLSDHLEELADAGIMSFKIEGRLKDADYVKNIVSQVRRKLDDLLERRPELGRASLGSVSQAFAPDPTKTFQRGLSSYRIDGERRPMGNLDSGRHLGEFIGEVRSIQGDRLVLDATTDLHPGDGLAFVDGVEVAGTVINAVEPRQLFVQDPSRIRPARGCTATWTCTGSGPCAAPRWSAASRCGPRWTSRTGPCACAWRIRSAVWRKPRLRATSRRRGMRRPLPGPSRRPWAAWGTRPSSWRGCRWPSRASCRSARSTPSAATPRLRWRPCAGPREPGKGAGLGPKLNPLPVRGLDFTWNIANRAARAFYERAGAEVLEPAAELQASLDGRVVMTTRHCVKYEMGWCHVHENPEPWVRLPEPQGPVFLENGSTRLECRFDCARCRMELVLCEPQG
ncbi:MAG: U32 family peptidase [Holophagaceae bacterium]|nr:U32 family peptidase [Holophagaceae bacterium]